MAGNTTLSAKSWSNMLVHSTLYSTLFTALPLRRTCQVQLQLQINSIIFCKFLSTVHVYNQCTFQPALCFQCSIYSNKVTKSQICPKQISAKPVNRSQTCIEGFWFEIEKCICYNTILAVAGYPAIARYHRH